MLTRFSQAAAGTRQANESCRKDQRSTLFLVFSGCDAGESPTE
jgi:hypothetical protein